MCDSVGSFDTSQELSWPSLGVAKASDTKNTKTQALQMEENFTRLFTMGECQAIQHARIISCTTFAETNFSICTTLTYMSNKYTKSLFE